METCVPCVCAFPPCLRGLCKWPWPWPGAALKVPGSETEAEAPAANTPGA